MNTTLSYVIAGICVLVFLLFKEWTSRFLILSALIALVLIFILITKYLGEVMVF